MTARLSVVFSYDKEKQIFYCPWSWVHNTGVPGYNTKPYTLSLHQLWSRSSIFVWDDFDISLQMYKTSPAIITMRNEGHTAQLPKFVAYSSPSVAFFDNFKTTSQVSL